MRGTNIQVRKRLTMVFFLAGLVFICLIGRLAWIQFVHGEEWQGKAEEIRMQDVPVDARRGTIMDRNGNQLVTSISVDSIYAIPSHVRDPRDAARRLSPILEMDEDELYKRLTKRSSFEWLKRKIDFDISKQVKDLEIKGIKTVEENKRYYMHESLASHVLGFTGVDNQGLLGLEKSYDDVLKGKAGRIVVEYDAMGREAPEALHDFIDPVPGQNIVLTLDETIQYFTERELDKVVSTYDPKLAVVIVMDPRSGEMLAIANRPTFNPNHWTSVSKEIWDRNPAIWYNYEPGSTFKIITASAALDAGAVKPSDEFHDPGYATVGGRHIRCWKAGGHGSQTFEEVVQNSCNPGFIKVGLDLGKKRFYKYIRDYGFGQSTGLNLPGEEKGIIIPEKQATDLNIATMSIGQSIAVTPIQLITAASAAINDGKLMQPYLVKEITGAGGKVIKTNKPVELGQVISSQTSAELRILLEKVVSQGTGGNAFVNGYRVGGKTGTAQVVGSGGYVQGRYVASFVGFAPANDPQIAILVMIAEPQGGIYYGGQVAAPVFQAIAKDTLRYLGLPEIPGLEKPKNPWEQLLPKIEVKVPNVVNLPAGEAEKVLKAIGLSVEITGDGQMVYEQIPQAGAVVNSGTTVILDLRLSNENKKGKVTVPDLSGLTVKETADLLDGIGLYLNPAGTGLAIEQNIPPGSKVAAGSKVKVEFRPPGWKPGQPNELDGAYGESNESDAQEN